MEIKEHKLDGIRVLALKGKVTRGDAEAKLKERILDLCDSGHNRIIINLADVPYVDSSGIGELVRCYTEVRRSGGRLGLTNCNHRLLDMLRMTRLSDILETFDSDADAVQSFSRR